MTTAVFIALGLLVYQAKSQICGPGLYPGLLGLDGFGAGPCGPLPQIGPIPPQIGPLAAQFGPLPQIGTLPPQIGSIPCGQPAPCGIPPLSGIPSCGLPTPPGIGPYGFQGPIGQPIGIPPCGQVPCGLPGCVQPSCGVQVPQCGVQVPQCGVQVPQCGVQVPQCGVQVPQCGVQVPQCGVQVPQCGVQVPQCGVQVPQIGVQIPQCLQSPIINAPLIPNQCQCSYPNQCNQCFGALSTCDYQGPVTTVIDNTLANSLANALQLLIVSNLLENSLAPGLSYPCDVPNFGNVIDYPCNQIVTCEPVYEIVTPITQYMPCQEPISFAPCVEIPSANCGLNPYANSFGNFGLDGHINPYANNFGFSDCGLVNPYANGFGSLDSVFSPVAAEVLFPAEIPAQLTCNFGYMTSNVPCVSVNVEALPFSTYC